MSALGQKQTYAPHNGMSAFPPIATEKADIRKRSCPLYPQKRTCAVQRGMSALCQKQTWRLILEPRQRARGAEIEPEIFNAYIIGDQYFRNHLSRVRAQKQPSRCRQTLVSIFMSAKAVVKNLNRS